MIYEIKAKTALNCLKSESPYGWDLNIYRGCGHYCRYCFAQYSHRYLGSENFFSDIFVKTNIAECLDRQLSAKNWKGDLINIGGVTDSYQPAEKKYKIMRDVLAVMLKHKNPVSICTKSTLILRDFDLLDKLSRVACVAISATITTVNETIRKQLEPNCAPSSERFNMLKEFRKTNALRGVLMIPVVPYLTDTEDNFRRIFSLSKEIGLDWIIFSTLHLRGNTRKHFFEFLAKEFPDLCARYAALYRNYFADRAYKNKIYSSIRKIQTVYGISDDCKMHIAKKLKHFGSKEKQLFLFQNF